MVDNLNLFNQGGLFGPAGGGFGGLLDPRAQAMLGAAQVLSQAGGPSRMPISTGAALSSAMAQGVNSYRQAQAAGMQQQMNQMKFDQAKRAQAAATLQAQQRKAFTDALAGGDPAAIRRTAPAAYPGKAAEAYFRKPAKPQYKQRKIPVKDAGGPVLWQSQASHDGGVTWTNLGPAAPASAAANVSLDMRQEGAEKTAYGKSLVDTFNAINVAADSAETQRVQIQMARTFASQDDDSVNRMPSLLQQAVGNAAVGMGFDVSGTGFKEVLGNISSGQSFQAVMENLVLSKMQAQKGPQTEGDTKRIKNSLARLGNTPDARDFLLKASDALAQADVMKADFWRRWRNKSPGRSFDGAASAWRKFRSKVPLVGISPTPKRDKNNKLYHPTVFFAEFMDRNRHKTFEQNAAEWSRVYAGTKGSR